MDRYYWWKMSDLFDFFVMAIKAAVELGPSNVRIEFRPADAGKELKVVDATTGTPCGEYDIVHVCPPDCD